MEKKSHRTDTFLLKVSTQSVLFVSTRQILVSILSDRVCAVAFYHQPQLIMPKSRLSLLTIVDSGFRIMV